MKSAGIYLQVFYKYSHFKHLINIEHTQLID